MDEHYRDELLSAYLDGDLEQQLAREVEAHLADCPLCREALDELTAVRDAAGTLEALEPSQRTWYEIRRRTVERRSVRPRWAWIAVPAAAAAALLVVVLARRPPAGGPGRFEAAGLGTHGAEAAAEMVAEYDEYLHGIEEAIDECEAALAENPGNRQVRFAYLDARTSRVQALDHMASYGGR